LTGSSGSSLEAVHGGHPVLTMAAMIRVPSAATNKIRQTKSNGRIDPLVAVAMAISVPSRAEKQPAFDPRADRLRCR
jgi:hypothetical protein